MQTPSSKEITGLLVAWGDGDQSALEQLAPLVQSELHRLAHHYMGRERPGHTLQTSALVNEAYIRLIDWKNVRWQNRAHFFAVSAQMMRRILVDYARSIDGVDVGVLIEERPDGTVKASLRSKDPRYRLDRIAAQFNGGGHACAAGLSVKLPTPELRLRLLSAITAQITAVDAQKVAVS